MLVTIIIWLYTFFLCYVYGFLFLKLAGRLMRIEADLPAPPLILVAGLVALTTLASFFSLFIQIGLWVDGLLLAGALAGVLARLVSWPRFARPMAWLPLAVMALALLIVLENATHRPLNPDTNIYHAQAIHWIESYPAVPGLGNLHGRLAFNSAWFVSNALFSFSFLGLRSFHLLGSLLFLAGLYYCGGALTALGQGKYTTANLLKILFFPLAFSLLGAEVSSPGSDFPVSLLLWLLAVLWAEQEEATQPFHPLLSILIAVFAVTIKLSAAPILLLAALFLGRQWFQGERRRFLWLAVCGALVLLPFLARNIILSGYLLYPFPSVDLFSFDWKVPLERAIAEREAVLAWGRFPRMDAAQALAMPFGEWFPRWLADQTLNRRVILFAAMGSALVAVPGLLARRPLRSYWLGWVVFYMGSLFWLLTAPDFRFGYGFLIATILLALAPWLAALLQRMPFPASRVLLGVSLILLVYLGLTLATSFEARTLVDRLVLPADYDRVPTQACEIANGSVFCAKAYNACSYDAFPCVPSPRPNVWMRGASLGDGFRTRP